MAAVQSEERSKILQRRRELRKAKKQKAKHFKTLKHQARCEKKAEIVAKIRAKRDEVHWNDNNGENGCWLCGEVTHRKQDCPNRALGELNKTCYQCRRRGHTSQNCPQKGTDDLGGQPQQQSEVCFNCGDGSHSLRHCPKPIENGGATHATCFVCKQQGHLSSKCPQNKTGVYPKGGCCKLCKSIEHLARDCPVGNISVDGSSSGKNKKTKFSNDDDGCVDYDANSGDALDAVQLSRDGCAVEDDDKQADTRKSKKYSKRVKF
ncbi:zinc knuckle (cchc-type) family protein [Plasmopara halstedii]|uniref:Zinc knuckle (Cchc-type) family protein n=1 Tax=Plasmopara halstedii TaxID=4781 RepID=A0A0P1AKP9_PLAHL|nr:zinc knuckle (cchc-type) family protein [Plasmopara halstedii]CEG41153.1 zinc knuckle (cchc-type) family protein [Plasmopara halstedii]|eukprot:XP_024577522.1 zinc knuckle (cchc-type) family protein [Plasmopara halstedii]